jgi:hypothetical protein
MNVCYWDVENAPKRRCGMVGAMIETREELLALVSSWTRVRMIAFPEPPYGWHRCGGCGRMSDTCGHPVHCDRRARRYRGEWNAFYDDLRGDPKRMRLARKYFACAVAELDNAVLRKTMPRVGEWWLR